MNKNNRIDILFFERPLVDLKRYAFKIASYLKKLDDGLSLASISLELPEMDEITNMDAHYLRKEIRDIDAFLKMHAVRMIVFTNPRIPDMEIILHAHKMGIKTVMIQESVISSGGNINDISIKSVIDSLRFLPKTLYYFYVLYRMCRYDDRSYLKLLYIMVRDRRNVTSIVAHYFSPYLIADYVLTMGEYWNDYYEKVMKYEPDRIKVMGDHDLDYFTPHEECEPAICYITTVLVEDGTVRKADFEAFVSSLAKCVDKKTKLYIKLHPRSDKKLYRILKEHNVEFIRDGDLPAVNIYIGHRSTMLAKALYESDNLIIWKFNNSQEDFFERFAKDICSDETELQEALNSINIHERVNSDKKEIMKYFYFNKVGAIKTAAQLILQYMKNNIMV